MHKDLIGTFAFCDEHGCGRLAEVPCAFHRTEMNLCRNHAHVVGESGSSKTICGDCLAAAGAVE